MLKVNADEQGRDYLDYLIPFVLAIVAIDKSQPVTVDVVKHGLRREFGLRIPAGPVEMLLRRLRKRRVLRAERGLYFVDEKFKAPDLEPRRAAARASTERVITALVEFASGHNVAEFGEGEAVAALTAYLSRFCIECLQTYAQRTALPKAVKAKHKDIFIVNLFVNNALANNTALFEDIVVLVKGHMLANALICPDLESIQQTFSDVTFYLDTPFILQLLHVQGEERYEAAAELMELLGKLRAKFGVFYHTAQEVHHVLEMCEKSLERSNARALIVLEMRKAGKTRADLILLRNGLDRFYGRHYIAKVPTPKYKRAFQIDEKVLGEALDEEVKYWNTRALEYDINSIRSIYALRQGLAPTRLENCRAVLVTTNYRLARVAYIYGRETESSREVSSVITNFSLGNVAWLKAPLGSDLPRREIMVQCYAAMEPSHALWLKFLAEIERMNADGTISATDHEALRLSYRAREELMNLTLGEERAFSPTTIGRILEIVKDDYTREHRESLAAERTAHETTKAQLRHAQSTIETQRSNYFWRSRRFGSAVAATVFILMAVSLVTAALAATHQFGGYFHGKFWTFLLNCAVFVAATHGVLDSLFGFSVVPGCARLRDALARWRYRKLCSDAGIAPD